jgi:hypothetical protein
LLSPAALAQERRWDVELSGNFNFLTMAQFNGVYGGSVSFSSSSGFSGSASGADLTSVPGFGFGAGYRINPQLRIGLDVDYLMASSTYDLGTSAGSTSSNVNLDFNLPLLAVGPSLRYLFKQRDKGMSIGGGVMAGYAMLAGASVKTGADVSGGGSTAYANSNVKASGGCVTVVPKFFVSYAFGNGWSVLGEMFYRIAKISKVKTDGAGSAAIFQDPFNANDA